MVEPYGRRDLFFCTSVASQIDNLLTLPAVTGVVVVVPCRWGGQRIGGLTTFCFLIIYRMFGTRGISCRMKACVLDLDSFEEKLNGLLQGLFTPID